MGLMKALATSRAMGGRKTQFTLSGDVQVQQLFNGMPKAMMNNMISIVALSAGAGVIKNRMVANAQQLADTGLLAKSIKVKPAKNKFAHSRLVVIGPTHMKRALRRTKSGKLRRVALKRISEVRAKGTQIVWYDPGNYAHLVEYGTAPHLIRPEKKKAMTIGGEGGPLRKLVLHPGTKAQPFIRTAFDATKEQAAKKTADKLNELLIAHARKKLWKKIKRSLW